MPEGIPKNEEEKKPADAGENESKSESKDARFREKAHNLISYVANWRRRRKLEREGKKVPEGEKGETSEKEKKEAAKGFLGLKLGGATLVGAIALALAGAIIGLQKLATLDKWFMKGVNSVSGGGKGGGGKKEKA